MALTPEEKQQAVNLAKGMLMAQRDSVSLAGNIINNPHFASVPHSVKMEALRQYSKLEDEDEYKATVNVAPDRAAIAKAVGRTALSEGAASLPLSAVLAVTGSDILSRRKGKPHLTDALANNIRSGNKPAMRRFISSVGPLVATLFAANAATGGAREYFRQKDMVEQARTANKYLDKIRGDSTDADINAMLFASHAKSQASQAALKRSLADIDYFADKNDRVITIRDLAEPENSLPGIWMSEQAEALNEPFTKQSSDLTPKPMKTSKKSWGLSLVLEI